MASINESSKNEPLKIKLIVPLVAEDLQVVYDCLHMLKGFFSGLQSVKEEKNIEPIVEPYIISLSPKIQELEDELAPISQDSCSTIVCIGDTPSKMVSEICGRNNYDIPIFTLAYALDLPDEKSPYTYRIWPIADKMAVFLKNAIDKIRVNRLESFSKILILHSANCDQDYKDKYYKALKDELENDFKNNIIDYEFKDIDDLKKKSQDSLVILIGYGSEYYL